MTAVPALSGRTVFMSGGSRGIGLAIAERLAADGANIAIFAKTAAPHRTLPGTVHTAAAGIEQAAGTALPIVGDVRDQQAVEAAVAQTVDRFGALDILINNASAVDLSSVADMTLKRFDLVHQVNVRGTFSCIQAALPHLLRSDHGHVLTLSPPLALDGDWTTGYPAYTLSKFGMSMLTLSAAAAHPTIAANCLWPRTIIATSALDILGDEALPQRGRTPQIMADAAYEILRQRPGARTGQTLIDDEVLAEAGVADLTGYAHTPGSDLALDLFVSSWPTAASRG